MLIANDTTINKIALKRYFNAQIQFVIFTSHLSSILKIITETNLRAVISHPFCLNPV